MITILRKYNMTNAVFTACCIALFSGPKVIPKKKKPLTDKSASSLTMPSKAHDGYPAHPAFRASVVHILRHQQLHMEDPIGKSGYQQTL